MPKAKIDGWKCSKCGHEWCPKESKKDAEIMTCSKCQNKEVNRDIIEGSTAFNLDK
jgi:NAD-dependent SIR2 family protein deacetylase